MTIRDCYRLTLHTIKENPHRSILTVVISAFLSFLIMGMMALTISFGINGNRVIGESYFCENSLVNVTYSNSKIRGATAEHQTLFTEAQYDSLLNTVEKYDSEIDYIHYRINSNANLDFTDPNYPINVGINIVEGRNIEKSEGRNEAIIYVGSVNADSYVVGETYSIEERIVVLLNSGTYITEPQNFELKIVGKYDYSENIDIIKNGEPTITYYHNFIADIGAAFNTGNENIYIDSCEFVHYNKETNKNPLHLLNRLDSLKKEINKVLPQATTLEIFQGFYVTYGHQDGASCKVYTVYSQNFLERFIIIAIATMFSIILLLISVGSLANSVMISIDTNKKFIGLLKALGMKGFNLKLVVILESMTLIALGVLIGYCLLFAFTNPLTNLLTMILYSAYSSYYMAETFKVLIYIPIYLFIGTIFLFLLFTIIFSSGSLNKIARMEPITVINEVS